EDTNLTLTCPGVKEPLRLPLAELRSLISLRPGEGPPAPSVAGKAGRLEIEGVNLKGRLVNGSEQPDASCLVWHPDLGLNASPLVHGVSGRIVYRDSPLPAPRPGAAGVMRIQRAEGGVVIQQIVRPDGRIMIQAVGPAGG